MPQFPQRLGFDLADALAGYTEVAAHFFKSAAASVFEAEAELQDTRLTLVEGFEYIPDLFFEKLVGGGVFELSGASIDPVCR